LRNTSTNIQEKLINLKDNIKNKFKKGDSSNDGSIELIDQTKIKTPSTPSIDKYFPLDKGKGIAEGETSDLEFARRQLSPKLTGLTEIRSDNFEQGSGAVLNEIEQFFKYHHNSAFPKVAIQVGLYKTLRDRLSKLYETNNEEYNNLIQDEKINAKIN
jgi:hypothetical protein